MEAQECVAKQLISLWRLRSCLGTILVPLYTAYMSPVNFVDVVNLSISYAALGEVLWKILYKTNDSLFPSFCFCLGEGFFPAGYVQRN